MLIDILMSKNFQRLAILLNSANKKSKTNKIKKKKYGLIQEP